MNSVCLKYVNEGEVGMQLILFFASIILNYCRQIILEDVAKVLSLHSDRFESVNN